MISYPRIKREGEKKKSTSITDPLVVSASIFVFIMSCMKKET